MEWETIWQHLADAERHLATGARNRAQLSAIVEDLERDGHAAVSARYLLAMFENIEAMLIANRDKLRAELKKITH
jgi:hypothetical protein